MATRKKKPTQKPTKKPTKKLTRKPTKAAKTVKPKKPAVKAKPKPAAPKARAAKSNAAAKKKAELSRLRREERALENDVENESEGSKLSESPEYIPEAMEDSLAEQLGEGAVASATSGDQADENIRDEDLAEEEGGPFVETSARQEFASGTDASNPIDAEPAEQPTANARRKK